MMDTKDKGMISKLTIPILAALVLVGNHAEANEKSESKSDYYEQVVSLLDPSNPMPRISAEGYDGENIHELGDVKVGMSVSEVISLWGKPRALGITGARRGAVELKYGEFLIQCFRGKVLRIRADYYRVRSEQPASKPDNIPTSLPSNYLEKLCSILTTNAVDIRDVLTDSVITVDALKNGELGGVRLGMSMSDTVSVLGKPPNFCRFSTKNAVLYYDDSLKFNGDCLTSIHCYFPDDHRPKVRFDNGLTGTDTMPDFVKAFGPPGDIYPDHNGWFKLYYQYGKTYVYFIFMPQDEFKESDFTQEETRLHSISVHFHGREEIRNAANNRLIDSVAGLLEINRQKIQSLRWTHDLSDVTAFLEKELGNPLTETQQRKVASALEIREKAHQKALEDAVR